jgi:hypothetical protein
MAITKKCIKNHEAKWPLESIGRSLVREDASHQQTCNSLTATEIWSWAPDGYLTPRQTGRLTVGRSITLTLTSTLLTVSRYHELDLAVNYL